MRKIFILSAVFLAFFTLVGANFINHKTIRIIPVNVAGDTLVSARVEIIDQSGRTLASGLTTKEGIHLTVPDTILSALVKVQLKGYADLDTVVSTIRDSSTVVLEITDYVQAMIERQLNAESVVIGSVFSTAKPEHKDRNIRKFYNNSRSSAPEFSTSESSQWSSGSGFAFSVNSSAEGGFEKNGELTAGEIHDFSKWDLWSDITETELGIFQNTWDLYPRKRIAFQLVNEQGAPVVDEVVHLVSRISGKEIWTSRTDNTGKAELWYGMNQSDDIPEKKLKDLEIRIGSGQKVLQKGDVKFIEEGVNHVMISAACNTSDLAEIAFVVDATGSMQDEINYLKADLMDIVDHMEELTPGIHVNTGAVFYKCFGNDYVTQTSPLNSDISATRDFVIKHNAKDGGTEAVEEALRSAIDSLNWSESARARIIFLILDEPPGITDSIVQAMQLQIARAAAMGIRIIPVVSSGAGYSSSKSLEYLMRSVALLTNGTYVFLTDDSGIGNKHTAPTTDSYEKEKLNGIFRRLIRQYTYVPECPQPLVITDMDDHKVHGPQDGNIVSKDTIQDPVPHPPFFDTAAITDQWRVFPVPTTGPITVEPPDFAEHIYLTDMTGKLLLHASNTNEVVKWDLHMFAEGIYFIKAEGAYRMETRRIILAH